MNNNSSIYTTISVQLMQAVLTMITVMSAVTVYILENQTVNLYYYVILFISFIFFVLSIFYGGKGLTQLEKGRTSGNWFNRQAIMALLGIVFFCTSVFLGKSKADTIEMKLNKIEKDYKNIQELIKVRFAEKNGVIK